MSQFLDEFRPERGDLIYGIWASRANYRDHYKLTSPPDNSPLIKLADPLDDNGAWASIDDYNLHLDGALTNMRFECDKEVERILTNAQKVLSDVDYASRKKWLIAHYLVALNLSRYRPSLSLTDQKQIKNLCKFGIGLAATRFNAKVHFVLDGLDLGKIARNEPFMPDGPIPITNSELRYVYRHHNALTERKGILFYVNYTIVPAPWTINWEFEDFAGTIIKACTEDWDDYGGRREKEKKSDKPLV